MSNIAQLTMSGVVVLNTVIGNAWGLSVSIESTTNIARSVTGSSKQMVMIQPEANRFVDQHACDTLRWPTESDIAKWKVWTNRWDATKDKNRKDKRATSVTNACLKAKHWIQIVLKEEWIPSDVENRLIPLQKSESPKSLVVCRYEMRSSVIQVSQSVSHMWVVVTPSTNMTQGVRTVGELGERVFTNFFTMGKEMTRVPCDETEGKDGLHVFGRQDDRRVFENKSLSDINRELLSEWWGWDTWYTDGRSVAILFHKKSSNSTFKMWPGDPWF